MGNYKIYETEHEGIKLRIEESFPEVGAYLYVFKGKKCIKDFLQNNISVCKKFALEKYGVPINQWLEIVNPEV